MVVRRICPEREDAARMLLPWAALFAGSILAGYATCAALVARRRAALIAMLVATAAGLAAVAAVVGVARLSGRADATVAATFIAMGGYLGGFALAATLVPAWTRLPPLPGPVPADPQPASDGSPAIVLVAGGQPETYDPAVLTHSYSMLAGTDVPVPPDAVRVFGYMSERVRYRSAGLSPARPVALSISRQMAERLRDAGHTGPVTTAWLEGTPRLADVVHRLASQGSRDVIVVSLGVAESLPLDRARIEAEAVARPGAGVRLCYTHSLWADESLAHLVAGNVLAALPRGPRPTDGVVLVGLGQPWQWDRENPRSCEQETFFLQRVRAALVTAGTPEANVRTAWLDWQDPGVTEVARHLAALGCERIIVVPATTCADTLETIVDLPSAVEQADLDPGIRVQVLHGWGENEIVADALTRAVLETARECGLRQDQ
jgi:protoheme ferro-lyase